MYAKAILRARVLLIHPCSCLPLVCHTDLGEMLAEDGVISGRRRQLSDLQSRLAAAVRVLEHPTRCLVE